MNNMLKRLVVAALAISASHLSAHTNQGFLSVPRAQHASLLADSHVTRDLAATKGKDRFGGNFLVSGFYSESTNKKALGKYFGVNDKDSFDAVWGTAANGDATNTVNAAFLVHDDTEGGQAAPRHSATVTLAPKTISYGMEFAYVQCLGKILEGLHLAITLPVERVENNMNLTAANKQGAVAADLVTKFLAGTLANANGTNINPGYISAGADHSGQNQLKNALINGKQGATGIADIEAVLGYDFVRNEDWTAGLNIGLLIPTGNSATGKYAFEPIYGNGGHWELGFGGRVDGKLWRDGDQTIGLHLGADYRYGFQANETRTLSITKDGIQNNWNQYFLAGVNGQPAPTEAPFANTQTVPVSVTPNSALRANLGLHYGNGGFLFGAYYAPAWKQAETVKVTPTVAANTVVVALTQATNANIGAAVAGVAFDASNVNADSSKRPAQLAHRLGADMGYTFKEWEYPVALGLGGHYELANDNATVENWGVSVKAGIGF